MADPFLLIERGYLFLENDLINDAMQALYDPEIIIEDGRTTVTLRAIPDDDTIRNVFEQQLQPFLHPYADNAFTPQEVQGLLINIVLYDASLDETFGLQGDLPAWYYPRLLLERIGDERGFVAGNKTHNELHHNNNNAYDASDDLYDMTIDQTNGEGPVTHILLWSSERLFPYFKHYLGLNFVLDSLTMEANSYLHCYLGSSFFRIMNPYFVERLLEDGFRLTDQNVRGETPLHSLVYKSDLPFASLTDAEVEADPQSQAVNRYRQFYRTMMILFQDPSADMDIQNDTRRSVRQLLHEEHMKPMKYDDVYNWYALRDENEEAAAEAEEERKIGLVRKNALEAYNVVTGRPRAIERAKQQKLARALTGNMFLLNKSMNPGPPTFPSVSRPVGSIIEEMLGTNLKRAQAVVEKRGMNNTRRRKGNMLHELQSPTLNNTRRKREMLNELLSRSRNNRSGGRYTKKRVYKKRKTRR